MPHRGNAPDNATLIGFTNLRHARTTRPLVIEKGRGIFLIDENGREYIEGTSSFYSAALGFSDPELVEAAIRQMRQLPAYASGLYRTVPAALALGEKLAAMAPMAKARVAFASTGSEANDFLIKFLRFRNGHRGEPRRVKVIARALSYHGATVATAPLGGFPGTARAFNLPMDDVITVSQPDFPNDARAGEDEAGFTARLLAEIEQAIERAGPETVGAMILDPVSFSAGCVVPPAGYLTGLRAILDRYGILLFDDEVITGFCRTGSMFAAQTFGMRPDCMTLAKALSAAYFPISAIVMDGDFYDALERGSDEEGIFSHAATYGGHPVAAAVALRMIEIIEERDLLGHVRRVGPRLQKLISSLSGHPMVFNTRGIGLGGAVQLHSLAEAVGARGRAMQEAMMAEGLLLRVVKDTINFAPPLIITEAEVDELFARFTRALAAVERGEAVT
ncbi:MAG: aminotransferase class III-fold pyridoxal phosphate-dependent enzyme [Alphaproteobacteria bacterium]|nr:aminotransferase class III-fold pyridoxal phosphate-dependent enzyme [Alphaproteobacteria bacterium]